MSDEYLCYGGVYSGSDSDDDFQAILVAQRRELSDAQALESDLDYAFHLQLQEAMSASLALVPPNSSAPEPDTVIPADGKTTTTGKLVDLQSEVVSKLEQHNKDTPNQSIEGLRSKVDDLNISRDNRRFPDEDWRGNVGYYRGLFGEGTSSSGLGSSRGRVVIGGSSGGGGGSGEEVFRVYLKGLVSEEKVNGRDVMLVGIGVAICDSGDNVIYEIKKPLIGCGTSRQNVEVRALIEGLNAALALDLKRLICFADYYPVVKYVTRRWTPKTGQLAALVNQVVTLRTKFISCRVNCITRSAMKFAFKLAREAIMSQITVSAESSSKSIPKESCVICLEDSNVNQIFSVDNCLHRYCFSCMKQHVEVKLLHGMLPKCPHETCKSDLNVESCKTFLTPRLLEIMEQRLMEAAIPTTEKIYCPYPKCSALMSKTVLQEPIQYHINLGLGARNCTNCNRIFCIQCKVPWHNNMTCFQYKRLHPHREEETKLKSLATRNLWRQCVKCNHMIELAEGCYHITCRCGSEFCYTCGAEWKNKKATCKCPLWDERNIIDDDEEDDEDGEYFYSTDEDDRDDDWETDSESDVILDWKPY